MSRHALPLLLASLLVVLPATTLAGEDLSTPEKAFESFTKFWKQSTQETDYWRALQEEAEKPLDACRTEKFQQKRAAAREKGHKGARDVAIVWEDFEVTKKVPGEKTAMFVANLNCKIRTPTFDLEGSVKETAHKEPYSLHFEKHGDAWLLAELWRACNTCRGLATCQRCAGTGYAGGGTCPGCRGSRSCSTCSGKSRVKDGLTHSTLVNLAPLFLPTEDFTPSLDLSTPRAATKAYMDSWIQREIVGSKKTKAWLDENMPRFEAFLTPKNAEVAKRVLEMAFEQGRARAKGLKHEIESVTESGERAVARTIATLDKIPYRDCFRLEKSGDKWLADAHLSQQCIMCAGKGVCAGCKGEGKAFGMDPCPNCKGSRGCETCKNLGMVETD